MKRVFRRRGFAKAVKLVLLLAILCGAVSCVVAAYPDDYYVRPYTYHYYYYGAPYGYYYYGHPYRHYYYYPYRY